MEEDDYDEGLVIQAFSTTEVLGDIKEATFNLRNPGQFAGKSFYCSGSNGNDSPNILNINEASPKENYFTSSWTEWSKCNDVKNNELVFRSRMKSDGTSIFQNRYCRCSDLQVLPSPRSKIKYNGAFSETEF